jgi:hypothetical protein
VEYILIINLSRNTNVILFFNINLIKLKKYLSS